MEELIDERYRSNKLVVKIEKKSALEKTERKMVLVLLFIEILFFIVSWAGIISDNTVIFFGSIVGIISGIPLISVIITKKYWRCPECGNALPNTWLGMRGPHVTVSGCLPLYEEICPKCGFSLVEGKSPLTEEEILEDKRQLRKRMADFWQVFGMTVFVLFLVLIVFAKKG